MLKTRKVVIIGAGHVGSHVALALIQSGEADDIVLIDILKEKAAAQALDLDDCVSGALCGHDAKIRAGEYSELNDADILVMAFGRSRRPGENRLISSHPWLLCPIMGKLCTTDVHANQSFFLESR